MLIGQVLNSGIEGQPMAQIVAAAEVNFLVGLSQVAIGQKHGIAKKRITQEGAVIAAAYQVTAQPEYEFWPGITQQEAASMRGAAEWTVADQRRKRSYSDTRDVGVVAERWSKRR